jgi:succinyl-CoA synthetase alpha subunit
MSILVNAETSVVVQGITGREGSFHTRQMLEYGTKIVAGVTPGKGGEQVESIPVFDTVKEATRATGANTSIIYVPARFAAEAIYEAADAGISLIVCITEGIPTLDMVRVYCYLRHKETRLIGPNSPGIISPGLAKVGIMPGYIHRPGPVGVISRSGTLTYEVVWALTNRGIGQSTCIGLGGDPITGSSFNDILTLFQQDPNTEAIVLIGEIGGTEEERAAEHIRKTVSKPVVAFIAGQSAPPEKRMGHAGAIISGGQGTAREKIEALRLAGVRIADSPEQIPELLPPQLSEPNERE